MGGQFQPNLPIKPTHRVWFVLAIAMVLMAICALVVLILWPKTNSSKLANVSVAQPVEKTNSTAQTEASSGASTSRSSSSQQSANNTNCTPLATFDAPPRLSLSNRPAGLTEVIAPVEYYQIFGDTAAQLRTQIQQCAPKAEGSSSADFAAATGYSLSWKYSTVPDGSGSCTINKVRVGLHVNQVQPQWQATSSATSGLEAAWQKFVASIGVHENVHVNIDQQHASQLVRNLQAIPKSPCSSIAKTVQAQVLATVNTIGAANDSYDASTDHGASQGANLP